MQVMDIPDWLARWLAQWIVNKGIDWAWDRYGESVLEGYHVTRYQLTKRFKPPPKTTATLVVEVVRVA